MARPITPNMKLELPESGVDSRTEAERLFSNAFEKIDAHDHSSDKGDKIPSNRLNFISDMDVNNKSLCKVKSIKFNSSNDSHTQNSLYIRNGELWYRDTNGSDIQITQEGNIPHPTLNIETGSPAKLYYGSIGVPSVIQRDPDSDEFATVKATAISNLSNQANRTEKTVNNLHLGGYFEATLPSAPPENNFYYLWIAVPKQPVQNLKFYNIDYDRETYWIPASASLSDATIENREYKIYYRNIPYPKGSEVELIIKNFSDTAGLTRSTAPVYDSLDDLPSASNLQPGSKAIVVATTAPFETMEFIVTHEKKWNCISGSSRDLLNRNINFTNANRWVNTNIKWDFRFPFYLVSFGGENTGGDWQDQTWVIFDRQSVLGLRNQSANTISPTNTNTVQYYILIQLHEGQTDTRQYRIGKDSSNNILINSSDSTEDAYPFRIKGRS